MLVQVSAKLEPVSQNKLAVQFQEFRIFNLIPIKAPPSARGELAITYVDEDLRISRGDKGNLFVLTMVGGGQCLRVHGQVHTQRTLRLMYLMPTATETCLLLLCPGRPQQEAMSRCRSAWQFCAGGVGVAGAVSVAGDSCARVRVCCRAAWLRGVCMRVARWLMLALHFVR